MPRTPQSSSESWRNSRRLPSKPSSLPGFTFRVIATWMGMTIVDLRCGQTKQPQPNHQGFDKQPAC